MRIEPFKVEHIAELLERPSEGCMREALSDRAYLAALAQHESWTLRIGGRVMACGGVVPRWPGRAELWAVVANDIGHVGMLTLHRAVQRFISSRTEKRLEATVAAEFAAAHRWIRALGFVCETPNAMRHWLPDGRDAMLYSKVA